MKTNSIFFKIRIAFGLSVFLILSVFSLFYFIQKHYGEMELRERLMHALRAAKHMKDEPTLLNEQLKSLEFSAVAIEQQENILKRGRKTENLGHMGPVKIGAYELDNKRYIVAAHPKGIDIFEDNKSAPIVPMLLLAALVAILAVLSLFYRSILKGLEPLTELKTRVESYAASGELPPRSKPFCDEIETLSKAFDDTATHLSNISKARSLFLRNIAHELKTPLSKGRFLTEMVEKEELKERFRTLFVHFDTLINELLQVERLTAAGIPLDKKEYSLQDCIDEAIESGFLDEESVVVADNNERVCVDFRLFVLALKNLLTNGVKYSDEHKVMVETENKTLKISNRGAQLPQPIELLEQPFVKGNESAEGLGLGLYIVRQILDAHDAKLEYRYNDGIHSFFIELGNLSCKS